ncbi:hypothetical protein CC2G_013352 [Coprinopsis cinerea AmutBmut pab1-1]|nr:hypothetical protein CC2G_013352 [Coprinopsis cinerea AmutBmut pab1-1]
MPSLNRPPLPPGCALLRDVGRYLQSLVKHKNNPTSVAPAPPPQLDLELQIECELIADIILAALQNASGSAVSFHYLPIQLRSPPPRIEQTTWPLNDYLKASGRRKRTDKLTFAVEWLSKVPGLVMDSESETSFRAHPSLFDKGKSFKSGVITFASCWPMQGHPDGPYSPSANFKKPNQRAVPFLKMISESLAILGGILSVIHPAMFECGLDVLANLNAGRIKNVDEVDILRKVLQCWSSPFTAFSLILNRETPVHKDGLSPPFSYDLLYTGGFYEDARLEVHGIGLRVRYVPGTVVALLAGVFPHGVSSVNGERFCIAHFFRKPILDQVPFFRTPGVPKYGHLVDFYFDGFRDTVT